MPSLGSQEPPLAWRAEHVLLQEVPGTRCWINSIGRIVTAPWESSPSQLIATHRPHCVGQNLGVILDSLPALTPHISSQEVLQLYLHILNPISSHYPLTAGPPGKGLPACPLQSILH